MARLKVQLRMLTRHSLIKEVVHRNMVAHRLVLHMDRHKTCLHMGHLRIFSNKEDRAAPGPVRKSSQLVHPHFLTKVFSHN